MFVSYLLEIVLLFTGRRRSCDDPDQTLQEALRTQLRVVESNSKDVAQLFKVNSDNKQYRHFTAQSTTTIKCFTFTTAW